MKKIFFTAMVLVHVMNLVYAQERPDEEVKSALRKLATGYQRATNLGFDVLYRYAAESEPSVYRDSLSGHFKLQGNRYWCELDNTESVGTPDFNIMLFKDDKLMYLSRRAPSAANPLNQLAMVDSFLLAGKKNMVCSMMHTRDQDIATIEFTEPVVYKRITWYIDKKSGFLQKMVSVVQAGQLYDAQVRSQIEDPATWAIVEAVYSNYRQQPFDETLFDSSRYFKKVANGYVTVAPYEDYTIFLGSVGL